QSRSLILRNFGSTLAVVERSDLVSCPSCGDPRLFETSGIGSSHCSRCQLPVLKFQEWFTESNLNSDTDSIYHKSCNPKSFDHYMKEGELWGLPKEVWRVSSSRQASIKVLKERASRRKDAL